MSGPDPNKPRRHKRMPVFYEYYLTYQGRTLGGATREISPYGAGLFCEDRLAIGETADLTVIVPETAFKLMVAGVVRSCVANPDRSDPARRFVIGVEFIKDHEGELPLIARPGQTTSLAPSHTVTIERPAQVCYERARDFEGILKWSSGLQEVKVRSRDPDGRGRRVEFLYNFYIRQACYILEYSYDDAAALLSFGKVGGDEDITRLDGKMVFVPRGERAALATYQLEVTLAFVPSQRLVKWGTAVLMRQELKNFKKFVENTT